MCTSEKIYLLLGSNMGERSWFLEQAERSISHHTGEILARSAVYETEPWGFSSDAWFLNRVLEIRTDLDPGELIFRLKKIEKELGRIPSPASYVSRPIDIDLLLYNDRVIEQRGLSIPHPRLHLRKFTLVPLVELAPDLIHPLLNKSVRMLLDECKDQCSVRRLPAQSIPSSAKL